MVDEQFSNIETSQRQNHLSSSTCTDIEMDFNDQGIVSNDYNSKLENGISYDASTSSPESTSENAFNFNNCKYSTTNDEKNGEKKVHWNPSQVHALLDCIEKRMSDFRRKSVHKTVWLAIGKEMSDHGEFSVEHCYNKWKNLRRDIRLFSNTNSMQKLSIRNTYIMERVQRMVSDIGYEGSSRKSSSPLSPNFDLAQTNDNNGISNHQMTNKEFWSAYNNLDQESRIKLENNLCNYQTKQEIPHTKSEKTTLNDQNLNNFHKPPPMNNDTVGNNVIEESIISLLSDPAVSQAILMNPKLLDEILPGLDFTALMKKYSDAQHEMMHIPPPPAVVNSHIIENGMIVNQFPLNTNVSIGVPKSNNPPNQKKPPVTTNLNSVPHLSHNNDMTNSWPHQLYELLHNFRDEESRQMARLDQLVGYVQAMQESTKRRLSTINQLISLAGLLIPQK